MWLSIGLKMIGEVMNKGFICSFMLLAIILITPNNVICRDPASVNPIYHYDYYSNGLKSDSNLIGRVYFDPLPHYGSESRVIIEYYSSIESERGITFIYDKSYNTLIGLSSYQETVAGPIEIGDTVRCEFIIEPRQVGIIPMSFIFGEIPPPEIPSVRFNKILGYINAGLLIGPDGMVQHIGDEYVDFKYATGLGPYPDLLGEGLLFSYDIKPPSEYLEIPGTGTPNEKYDLKEHLFSVETEVTVAQGNNDTIFVDCKVSPYHYFEAGIIFFVTNNENTSILSMSPSFDRPADTNQVYEFSVRAEVVKSGVGSLLLGFMTPNPDRYDKNGVFADWKSTSIKVSQPLYFGIDENGKVIFITDDYPWNSLSFLSEHNESDINSIDNRYQFIMNTTFDKSTQKNYGDGYRKIKNYWYEIWKNKE